VAINCYHLLQIVQEDQEHNMMDQLNAHPFQALPLPKFPPKPTFPDWTKSTRPITRPQPFLLSSGQRDIKQGAVAAGAAGAVLVASPQVQESQQKPFKALHMPNFHHKGQLKPVKSRLFELTAATRLSLQEHCDNEPSRWDPHRPKA
jgi:hypothetical protein